MDDEHEEDTSLQRKTSQKNTNYQHEIAQLEYNVIKNNYEKSKKVLDGLRKNLETQIDKLEYISDLESTLMALKKEKQVTRIEKTYYPKKILENEINKLQRKIIDAKIEVDSLWEKQENACKFMLGLKNNTYQKPKNFS